MQALRSSPNVVRIPHHARRGSWEPDLCLRGLHPPVTNKTPSPSGEYANEVLADHSGRIDACGRYRYRRGPTATRRRTGRHRCPTEEVIITGTRRTDRTVTDSASPIDVITSAELRAQPAANMLDQVKNVVPSFFVGQNTISDASSLVRAPSLRAFRGTKSW